MRSDTYALYKAGQIATEDESCKIIGQQLELDSSLARSTFETACHSLTVNDKLVNFIRELKRITGIHVYAMSNIPRKEVEYLSREHPRTMSSVCFWDDWCQKTRSSVLQNRPGKQ